MKYSEIKERTRKLRANCTPEEKWMWQLLRKKKFKNYRFLRQHAIIYESNLNEHFFFVPDFYCSELKLIIELDGKIHLTRKDYDERRDQILKDLGYSIVRIKNEDLKNYESYINDAIRKIEESKSFNP